MKAEQHNQTDTNITAEQPRAADTRVKEGKAKAHPPAVSGAKKPERSTTWMWVVGFLAVVAVMVWMFLQANARSFESNLWVSVGDGRVFKYERNPEGGVVRRPIDALAKYPNSEQGKVARFQVAWFQLWELGIKNLGSQQGPHAIENVKAAKELYEKLLEEVKDDPILAPEAMYNIAVATETLTLENRASLDEARKLYGKLVQDKTHDESAFAKLAKQRLSELSEDKHEALAATVAYYERLGSSIRQWRQVQQAEDELKKLRDKEPPGKAKGPK